MAGICTLFDLFVMLYLVWFLAIVCVLGGLLGTVFPALPGTPLIFFGALLIGWWHDFSIIGIPSLITLGVLAVLGLAIDIVASGIGAKRVGASRSALVGATVGSFVGIFFSIVGIILGPFIGAFVGEYMARSSVSRATAVGFGTWIGLLIGTATKVAIAFSMVGLIALAIVV